MPSDPYSYVVEKHIKTLELSKRRIYDHYTNQVKTQPKVNLQVRHNALMQLKKDASSSK